MANEQKVTIRYETAKGEFEHKIQPGTQQYDQATGTGGTPGVLAATTTAAAISFTPVNPGFVFIRNLSTAATVRIRSTGGVELMRFPPKKMGMPYRTTATASWQIQATTAGGTANVDIRGFST